MTLPAHRRPRPRADDQEFRQRVEDAKARKRMSDVAGRHTKLKRRGRSEMVGLCPFHQERSPSFEVNDAKGTYHCHGCGAGGDIVRFLMVKDGMSFMDAVRALASDLFPDVPPEERARAAAEDVAARAAALDDARMMWERCVDPRGTPAETYLRRARGISMPLPPCVRFGVVPTSRDDGGRWKRPHPALVLACTDAAGDLVGLQRVFLKPDGSGKAWGKKSKLSLGRPRGAAVKIGRDDAAEITLCEGPEDGLSLAQELPGATVWISLGTGMMPAIEFPEHVNSIVIAAQNDPPGRAAADVASDGLLERAFAVRIMRPDDAYKDWNDQLRWVRA